MKTEHEAVMCFSVWIIKCPTRRGLDSENQVNSHTETALLGFVPSAPDHRCSGAPLVVTGDTAHPCASPLHPVQFSSVQSLSRVPLFATPWIAARQASLSITNSRSSLKPMSIESVMPSSHLISVVPFSSCPQSLPASESSPNSVLKTSLELPWWLSGEESACQARKQVRSLLWEDSTCHGAAKPVCHNYWTCALEPRNRS